ncbi:MAG: arginine deiminase-related protein [Woeseiaceae bacterium]|nr:arginine deiminase-related protein [Woeseiaceae bacterium]
MASNHESQLAGTVLMIRPVRFHSNPLTADSNRFQGKTDLSPEAQQAAALAEFNALADALQVAGIRVICIDDTPDPATPDAIFPNNWITTHADGTVVLYPMEAINRRTERRQDVVDTLATEHGFTITRVIDLSAHETQGHFLEGTGSLVLDRVNRIAYACLSSRTHLDALRDFAQRLDYDIVAFDAVDRGGAPIYHTNVLMNVGEELAVVCLEAIPRDDQRRALTGSLEKTGHRIVDITFDQLEAFAGNMLELRAADGHRVLAMSGQAHQSLTPEQLRAIEANATIVSAPIDRIEASAGGSVRCMLAEIHLPHN